MAIWRKNNRSSTGEEEEKETKTVALELAKEQEGKRKAIPYLNIPYVETEENNDAEIVLPTKRNTCMVRFEDKTPAPVINVHKYTTYISPKLMGMGCVACYFFVIVPENHRICPKCGQSEYLIDVAGHVNANKKRAI